MMYEVEWYDRDAMVAAAHAAGCRADYGAILDYIDSESFRRTERWPTFEEAVTAAKSVITCGADFYGEVHVNRIQYVKRRFTTSDWERDYVWYISAPDDTPDPTHADHFEEIDLAEGDVIVENPS